MKTVLRSVGIVYFFIIASALSSAQCNYNYGSITGYEPYYYNSYTVGENMTCSWYTGYPYAIYYANSQMAIDLSTNGGSTWTQIATKPLASCYYCYSTYSTTVTIPWTVNPSTTCLVRYREVPGYGCAYNITGYNYYNYSIYGYYFTIKPGCFQPAITQQPADQIGCAGSPLNVTVGLDLGPSPSTWKYEWFKGTASYSVSSTTPNLSFGSITDADAGSYKLVVTNQCSNTTKTVTSRVMNITVKHPAAFTTQPQSQVVCPGNNATLSTAATGTNVRYQWFKDGVVIPNATGTTYTIVSATTMDAATYRVVIQADCGLSVTSADAIVQVPPPPIIAQQPVGGGFCPGSTVTLSPLVSGINLSFQWYKGDELLVGETGMTLTIPNFQKARSGYYWLKATSSNLGCFPTQGTDHTPIYTFEPAVITNQPVSTDVCIGSDIELSVGAEGTDVQFQWYRNGAPIQNSNSYLLILENATASQAGDYTVQVRSVCNSSVTSSVAKVNVVSTPKIITHPQPQSVMAGSTLTLSINATDAREVIWYRNETEVSRTPASTFTINNTGMVDAGYYRAVVTNVCGSTTTRTAKIEVVDPATLVPNLKVAAEQLNIGDVPFGYSSEVVFNNLIENTGLAALEVSGVNFTGASAADFALTGGTGTFTVQPGESAGLSVVFKPSIVGTSFAQLVITSNSLPITKNISIQGNGVVRYSHESGLSFGNVELDESKSMCFNVVNNSAIDIALDQIISSNAAFAVTTNTPLNIAAGNTAEVCLMYTPAMNGPAASTISFMSANGGNSSSSAQGVGVDPTSVAEDALAAGMSVYPNPTSGTVTISTGSDIARSISIVAIDGREVAKVVPTQNSIALNLQDAIQGGVVSGTYTIVIETARGRYSTQIVVTR